ncbi:MAG: BNR-4 repeat-containing protein [Marinilabiliaceae bacterium]|nr:BNR-4 repeat-containing protein [Marinilabiliaceae bacterium]
MKKAVLLLLVFVLSVPFTSGQNKNKTLSNDGAWCWFSAPGAIYKHNNSNEIVTGWITADGTLQAAILNLESGNKQIQTITPQLEKDDHANPAFVELKSKEVLMIYSKHYDQKVRVNRLAPNKTTLNFSSTATHDIFDADELKRYPNKRVTYANPALLSKEKERLYCFGRWTGFKPNIAWSDDEGHTFTKSKVFISDKVFKNTNRPYVRYYSDGRSKIHIVFTDGHPRDEATNSVYYACYEKRAFWKADGTKICDMKDIPFEPKDATVVYKATKEKGRAWIYDIAVDKKDRPVILYARYPEETKHLYHYAAFDGEKWMDHQICNSGKWFPQTPEGKNEPEPHYSAGMTFHPLKPEIIYVSRTIKGVFEIEKRVTHDNGKTWDITPITQNSEFDNVRPIVPKNMKKGDKTVVLWMVNKKYRHYTNYDTRIDYMIDNK